MKKILALTLLSLGLLTACRGGMDSTSSGSHPSTTPSIPDSETHPDSHIPGSFRPGSPIDSITIPGTTAGR